jgi:hypothetical protein
LLRRQRGIGLLLKHNNAGCNARTGPLERDLRQADVGD